MKQSEHRVMEKGKEDCISIFKDFEKRIDCRAQAIKKKECPA